MTPMRYRLAVVLLALAACGDSGTDPVPAIPTGTYELVAVEELDLPVYLGTVNIPSAGGSSHVWARYLTDMEVRVTTADSVDLVSGFRRENMTQPSSTPVDSTGSVRAARRGLSLCGAACIPVTLKGDTLRMLWNPVPDLGSAPPTYTFVRR